MPQPLVSFVVPCYKLGHLLPECVRSILAQTYENLEILIMNDNSPDDTASVAESFGDPRVKHIHNKKNLGHLHNYNKGIGLCAGKYIWLISADDYLRSSRVLERYVELMEANPRVGYTFCPAIGVANGKETGLLRYSVYRERDCIATGHEFLRTLLDSNLVVAASALVRKECYDKAGMFPLTPEMEWSGDWYLWCAFAMTFDVGYLAEPMVCYRTHALSMTTRLAEDDSIHKCSEGDLAVPLMIMKTAREMRLPAIERRCLLSVADEYARQCRSKVYQGSIWSLTMEQFERSLASHIDNDRDRDWIRARVYSGFADKLWRDDDRAAARSYYLASIRRNPWRLSVYLKLLLLLLGLRGDGARMLGRKLRIVGS